MVRVARLGNGGKVSLDCFFIFDHGLASAQSAAVHPLLLLVSNAKPRQLLPSQGRRTLDFAAMLREEEVSEQSIPVSKTLRVAALEVFLLFPSDFFVRSSLASPVVIGFVSLRPYLVRSRFQRRRDRSLDPPRAACAPACQRHGRVCYAKFPSNPRERRSAKAELAFDPLVCRPEIVRTLDHHRTFLCACRHLPPDLGTNSPSPQASPRKRQASTSCFFRNILEYSGIFFRKAMQIQQPLQ